MATGFVAASLGEVWAGKYKQKAPHPITSPLSYTVS